MRGLLLLVVALGAGIVLLLVTAPEAGSAAGSRPPDESPGQVTLPPRESMPANDARRVAMTPETRPAVATAGGRKWVKPQAAGLAEAFDPADPVGLIVHGAVTGATGTPIDGVYVRLTRKGEREGMSSMLRRTRYSFAGLQPGTFTLTARVDGFKPFSKELELGEAPRTTRIDIALERSLELLVFVTAKDGQPFQEALNQAYAKGEFKGRVDVIAVATETAPGARLPWTEPHEIGQRTLGTWQEARFARMRAEGRAPPPKGCLGWIDLRRAPPLCVSLALSGIVLATQQVEMGAKEVRFALEIADLARLRSTVRAQIVAFEDGKPLAGVPVSFFPPSSGGAGTPADAEGRVVFECLPGPMNLSVYDQKLEWFSRRVVVEPATEQDLGPIRVARAVPLQGRVIDAAGKGIQIALRIVNLDRLESPRRIESQSGHRTNAEGEFNLPSLGRARYLLWAGDEKSDNAAWQLVDTTTGAPAAIQLTAGPAARLELTGTDSKDTTWSVVVFAPDGTPLHARRLYTRAYEVRLPPGDYKLEVWHDQQLVRTVPLVLGMEGAKFSAP